MTDDDTVQHHGCNRDGRDFIVGDIHGYLRQLEGLLAHVGFDGSQDRLFSVGDLIDRGPDSAAALQLVDAPWCFAVRGNHEQMMLDARAANAAANAEALWLSNGGAWSCQLDTQALTAHRQRAASLPLAMTITIETGARVGLVHADIGMAGWADFVTRLGEAPIKDTALWSRHTLSSEGLSPFHTSPRWRPQIVSCKARVAASWRATIKTRNVAGRDLRPNPKGQALFCGNTAF